MHKNRHSALRLVVSAGLAALGSSLFAAGTWSSFTAPAGFNPVVTMVLTDGKVLMAEDYSSAEWWTLTPTATGNYSGGTFTKMTNAPVWRTYYGHAVLPDGRVIITGGEYVSNSAVWTNRCDIFDPQANTWTNIPAPAGWANIGDPPHSVLADGRYFMGNAFNNKTAFYNPATNAFVAGPNKIDSGSEEGWVLAWDDTLINPMGVNSPAAEKYDPSQNKWISAGTLPVSVYESSSREPGAGVSLYDGRIFYTGGTGNNVLYTVPALPSSPGTWTQAASFPVISGMQTGAKDAMVSLLTNGKMLCIASPVDGVAGNFLSPTYWFEYNPTTNVMTQVTSPAISSGPAFTARVVTLPSGQVMFTQGQNTIFLYTPDGAPSASWKPTVGYAPSAIVPGTSVTVLGSQLNGLTQGSNYGDEGVPATNFPVIRLQSGANVYYCRTSGHSTMGITPGSTIHWTQCAVPSTVPAGSYTMTVVANGIPSAGYPVTIAASATRIKGLVNLDVNYLGRKANVPLSYEIRNSTTNALLQSGSLYADQSGNYEISTTQAGTAKVLVRGSHWLWRQNTPIVLNGTTYTGKNFNLINGDCDGNNNITTDDYLILSDAFDTVPADGDWDARADLDGNLLVNTDDYLILAGNFDISGD
jgi:hypothetical protein